jgi:hypothetical protein
VGELCHEGTIDGLNSLDSFGMAIPISLIMATVIAGDDPIFNDQLATGSLDHGDGAWFTRMEGNLFQRILSRKSAWIFSRAGMGELYWNLFRTSILMTSDRHDVGRMASRKKRFLALCWLFWPESFLDPTVNVNVDNLAPLTLSRRTKKCFSAKLTGRLSGE